MNENLFFDLGKLKLLGKNVIIGKTVRIRHPELVEIGDDCIIDDHTYISCALSLEGYVHIASGCKIIGGRRSRVTMGMFSGFSPNVVVAAGSDDYIGGIACPQVPAEYKGEFVCGTIDIGRHCVVGANSVVLPNVTLHEGSAVGALSLVNKNLKAWQLYFGSPARWIKARQKEQILEFERQFLSSRREQ